MSWNHQMLFEKSEFKSCTTGENTVVQIFMRKIAHFLFWKFPWNYMHYLFCVEHKKK